MEKEVNEADGAICMGKSGETGRELALTRAAAGVVGVGRVVRALHHLFGLFYQQKNCGGSRIYRILGLRLCDIARCGSSSV